MLGWCSDARDYVQNLRNDIDVCYSTGKCRKPQYHFWAWPAAVHMQNSGYILPKWPRLRGITNRDVTDAVPNLLDIFPVGFLSGSGRPCNIRTVTNVPSVAQSTYVLVVAIIYKS